MDPNPYAPVLIEPPTPPKSEETWFGFVALAVLTLLASIGAIHIAERTGVIVKDSAGNPHFWFEPIKRR